jgi:chorismate lyase/3-hydroxybenzoate synthase
MGVAPRKITIKGNNLSHSTLEMASDTSAARAHSGRPLAQILQTDGVLAVIGFGDECALSADPRHLECGLPLLNSTPVHEVWYADGEVLSGFEGVCSWSRSDQALIVARCIEESVNGTSQRQLVEEAYCELLELINAQGYSQIVRVWNYLPDINEGVGDNERYRQFCVGREAAFNRWNYQGVSYSSACALGRKGGNGIVYLLAGKKPVAHVENPRQVSAYHYPRQYGPASPSFARASLIKWDEDFSELYISGTSSIVGHESRHLGDLQGQLRTTISNLDTLLERGAVPAGTDAVLQMALLKVYVRNEGDYAEIHRAVSERYPGVPTAYLLADICRSELLLEIDGIAKFPEWDSESRPLRSACYE